MTLIASRESIEFSKIYDRLQMTINTLTDENEQLKKINRDMQYKLAEYQGGITEEYLESIGFEKDYIDEEVYYFKLYINSMDGKTELLHLVTNGSDEVEDIYKVYWGDTDIEITEIELLRNIVKNFKELSKQGQRFKLFAIHGEGATEGIKNK